MSLFLESNYKENSINSLFDILYEFNESVNESISEMYIHNVVYDNLDDMYLSESVSEKFNKIKYTIINKIKEFIGKIREWFNKFFNGLKAKNVSAKQFLKQNESKIKEKLKNWKDMTVDELTTVNHGFPYVIINSIYLSILYNYSESDFINSNMSKSELIDLLIKEEINIDGYGIKKGTYKTIPELMEKVRDRCIIKEANFKITKYYLEQCIKLLDTIEKDLTKDMDVYNELINKSNDTIRTIQSMKGETQEDTVRLNRQVMFYETMIEIGNQILAKTVIVSNGLIDIAMNTIKKYLLSK